MTGVGRQHAKAVRILDSSGAFERPWMREAFHTVPRQEFVPDTVWVWHAEDDRYHPLSRVDDEERWSELVHHPTLPVVTQVDDGRPAPSDGTGELPTSSMSAANAVLTMLTATDPEPGSRVLHIGTGTGYDSALLCERIGDRNLVTIEVDWSLAEAARERLRRLGYRPRVVCGDGEFGQPQDAPYDRVLCTASLSRVPFTWITQSAPGGRIVAPWKTTFQPAGLAVLSVDADRRSASGRFGMPLTFMDLRGQRRPDNPLPRVYSTARWEESRHGTATLPPDFLDDFHARFALGLRLPGVHATRTPAPDGSPAWWLATDTSWAYLCAGETFQWGPRDLAGEAEQAHDWWLQEGRPEVFDFGMTVDEDGQRTWLGAPDRPVA
ncbi:methyltransferase domain-containing protein [Streptomyces sp. NRRL F-5755]|uniref:methyltransferase domain-containing protein n=1 Tax=Streptomyces sp. NRRL F-5755 TaxID=1519475 RepID=UPI0006AECF10|nr:methyltransferase domain-containing protein [Streptomyces sp. NRRL F-5755]